MSRDSLVKTGVFAGIYFLVYSLLQLLFGGIFDFKSTIAHVLVASFIFWVISLKKEMDDAKKALADAELEMEMISKGNKVAKTTPKKTVRKPAPKKKAKEGNTTVTAEPAVEEGGLSALRNAILEEVPEKED